MSIVNGNPTPQERFTSPRAAAFDAVVSLLDFDPDQAISGVDLVNGGQTIDGSWYWKATFTGQSISSIARQPVELDWNRERRQRVSLALSALWVIEDNEREKELEEAKTDAALIASHQEYVDERPAPVVDERLTVEELDDGDMVGPF